MWLLNNLEFQADNLSALFLAVIAIVSIPALVYSYGYLKGHYSRLRIGLLSLGTLFFILSMAAVVCADNLLLFLFAWELMSLLSYFLVIADHQHQQTLEAGLIYMIMTHIGTAFLTAGFVMIYHYCGSFSFNIIRQSLPGLPLVIKDTIFLLLLLGFGTKAGIVPLHIWLPYAHPQAPSHISSIMSGVMIKIAVYGFLRIALNLLGQVSGWWGILILVLAAGNCFTGIMYALLDKDIKKILAYSSVENMGIILLGIGTAMVLAVHQLYSLALVAYTAALFHLVNHAVFKGLLFLGAGSVYNAAGTRDLEKLGGLIKRMPYTAVCFLIGALAISGLPPLNGFVSEWLVFQSLFSAAGALSGTLKVFFVLMMAVLAITGGLAIACFARVFGIGFLAMPRSLNAVNARESSYSMKFAMGILAVAAVTISLCSVFVWSGLQKAAQVIVGNVLVVQPVQNIFVAGSLLNMPLIAGIFVAVLAVTYVLVRIFTGPRKVSYGQTWDCGYYRLSSRNEYTATAFSKAIRIAFSFFFLPQRRVEKLRESYYHVRSVKYEVQNILVFKQYFYMPIIKGVFLVARRIRSLQMGSIHWYLGYILIVFLGVIIFALGR